VQSLLTVSAQLKYSESAAGIVQPPGIGIPPIADTDAHQEEGEQRDHSAPTEAILLPNQYGSGFRYTQGSAARHNGRGKVCCMPVNWPLVRTCLLIVALITAFNLGRYTVEFSGSAWGWATVILSIVVLAASVIGLIVDFWRAHAP
jgi:hypothetical protein